MRERERERERESSQQRWKDLKKGKSGNQHPSFSQDRIQKPKREIKDTLRRIFSDSGKYFVPNHKWKCSGRTEAKGADGSGQPFQR